MAPTSERSVAYGSGPEWSTHNYSKNSNVSLYSLTEFLNYDERPFSERFIVAGHPYDTYKESVESTLRRWERSWYTAGNITGEQHGIQSHVGPIVKPRNTTRTRHTEAELTRRITEWLLNWLRRWAAAAPLVDGSSGGSRTTGSGHALGAGISSGKSSISNAAGKRRREPGKDGDEDNNEQSKKAKTGPSPRNTREYLACPFLKYNPQRYGQDGRCCRRWPNVSRLKTDHIYQCHQVPGVQCPRCGGIIYNHNKFEHASCTVRNFQPREGADSSMMQELRSKSTARNESEEGKWHAVYGILFGVPREQQPSPYPDNYSYFRQAIVTSLQSSIGPIVRRALRAPNYAPGWEESVSRNITNDLIGLINRDFQPSGSLTVPHYNHDHDPSPSSSSETRGQASSSRTNQSYTEGGYSNQFSGNPTPGEPVGDGSGAQGAEELVYMLATDTISDMNNFLQGMGDWE